MNRTDLRISIVGHNLRAGGGISVGKNFINSITAALSQATFQIFVPAGLGYESCAHAGVQVQWHTYNNSFWKLGRVVYDHVRMPQLVRDFSPAFVVCLGNIGMTHVGAAQILLLQDAHYFYPEKHYARENAWHRLLYRYKRHRFEQDLRKTRVLLCQTKTAEQRIRAMYAFAGRIAHLPNAISKFSLTGCDSASVDLTKYGLRFGERDIRHRYNTGDEKKSQSDHRDGSARFRLFYLSRYYPHKNIELLVDVFDRFRSELKDVELYLTIAEDQAPQAKRLLADIVDKQLDRQIINVGPVQQEDIAGLFSCMDALVMPTTLESFSGTYLEAMAFGCPILTSDLDFAHEVCRDAALYFDPWSASSLLGAILQLRDDPALAAILISRGKKIVEAYGISWADNAAALIRVLNEEGLLQHDVVADEKPVSRHEADVKR